MWKGHSKAHKFGGAAPRTLHGYMLECNAEYYILPILSLVVQKNNLLVEVECICIYTHLNISDFTFSYTCKTFVMAVQKNI